MRHLRRKEKREEVEERREEEEEEGEEFEDTERSVHVKKEERLRGEEVGNVVPDFCRVDELSSDDSLAEFEFDIDSCDGHNLMNNSLLQVYRSAGSDMATATPTGKQGASAVSHSQSSSSDLLQYGMEPVASPSHECSEIERSTHSSVESRTASLPASAWVSDTCTSPKWVAGIEDTQSHVAVAMDTLPLVSGAGSTSMVQCAVPVEREIEVMSSGVDVEREGGRGEGGDGGWEEEGGERERLRRQGDVELSQGKSEETVDMAFSNSETRRKSKKVTFAPDVVDHEGKSLKVPLKL